MLVTLILKGVGRVRYIVGVASLPARLSGCRSFAEPTGGVADFVPSTTVLFQACLQHGSRRISELWEASPQEASIVPIFNWEGYKTPCLRHYC